MSIETKNIIDLIGTDNRSGKVVLTISDHLDWNNENYHLNSLEDKINAYLRFIESGEIFNSYPKAKGKEIVIEIVQKYDLSENIFIKKVSQFLKDNGIQLIISKLNENNRNP